jgi:AbrB family looped-hinge helix DNA binding protein
MPFGIVNGMGMTITIDKAGRVVLPKRVRERYDLEAGDTLELEEGESGVLLRPRKMASARLVTVGGRAVWDAPGAAATVDEIERAIGRARRERDQRAMGL